MVWNRKGCCAVRQKLILKINLIGLLELPADAPVGVNVREYLDLDDHVIDISITPNRGDVSVFVVWPVKLG